MSAAPCFLGIDVGTSSCKVVVVGARGEVLASGSAGYVLSTPRPAWAEQEPEHWIEGARTALAEALTAAGDVKPAAIGLSGQMHGLVALDRAGSVLRPAILWNDQRTEVQCLALTEKAGGLERLLELTNNPMLPGYTGGKILWMRDHEPDLFERMALAVNPKDYLRLRLTGEAATEVSDASGTGLFDVRRRRWSSALLDIAQIDASLLPRCYESDEVTGKVSPAGSVDFGLPVGVPVVGGGGDAVIQTTGSGIIEPGSLQITIGTAGIVAAALETAISNPRGNLQVFCNNAENRWHCMGVSMSGGGALSWFADLLRQFCGEGGGGIDYHGLGERAARAAAGSDGLLFLPYLMGERCPHPDPRARGAFVGLTLRHGDAEVVRSLMEGVVFALRDIFMCMARAGVAAEEIRVSGGGASSEVWRQILADVFGCPVVTVKTATQGAAYGAALLAGVGVGHRDCAADAIDGMEVMTRTEPRSELAQRYRTQFEIYQSLYGSLKPAFERISEQHS